MFKPSYNEIKNVMRKKGYAFFTNGNYNVNIIGVRTASNKSNSFNDWITLSYNEDGELKFHVCSCTTDPGLYWLENPSVVVYVPELSEHMKGTAILVPGQYRGVYTIRKHNGKYNAVCQKRDRNVKVYRDWDRDKYLDTEDMPVQEGSFGINIHRSNAYRPSNVVEKWSAGCQVFQDPADFAFFMSICYKSKALFGNSFTYTLLTEKDFN